MPNWGVSFLPGQGQNGPEARQGGQRQNQVQEAIKILSLRLPKVFGAQSLAPGQLLTAPGGMGQPGARGNVTAQAFAQLAGLPPSMAAPGGPGGPSPLPGPAPWGGGGSATTEGWLQRERDLNRPFPSPIRDESPWTMPQQPMSSPGPPRVTPGQTTDGGPDVFTPPGGGWVDPRPELPEPEPSFALAPQPAGASPLERPDRQREFMARKYLEMLDERGGGGW